MTTEVTAAKTRPLPAITIGRLRPHVSDVLLPLAVGAWLAGVRLAHPSHLGDYGLPPAIAPVLYIGLLVLVISAGLELARPETSAPRLACHAIALVVMLYGLAPLIYPVARYEWLYKTVGPVQYISAKGRLNPAIDIYQNWPGFFALTAWFDKVAGVASPLAYAKWAQLLFELAALPLLYLSYSALGLTPRQRWIAIYLYSASNWIGQDYLSPQALGTVLSLSIMAILLRWLYTDYPAGTTEANQTPASHRSRNRASPRLPLRHGQVLPALCALLLCYFVLVYTHELSPYILAVQVGMLAVFKLIRPRWLPLVMVAIAVAYLAPRFSFVNSHYGVLSSIGDFFSNAAPPAFSASSVPAGQHFIERCSEALSVGVWLLAAVAAWRHRRSGRSVLALAFLAFSPALLLGLLAYGHEGILRVFLFSLPWSAALASYVLAPSPVPQSRPRSRRKPRTAGRPAMRLAAFRASLAIVAALALFFPAFFGDDSFNQIPATQVSAVTSFWLHSEPGTVIVAIDDAAVADTWRYDQYPLRVIFGSDGLMASTAITPGIASTLARVAHGHSGRPSYVLLTASMEAYTRAYGEATPRDFDVLRASLAHSAAWGLVLHSPGVDIYELRATAGAVASP